MSLFRLFFCANFSAAAQVQPERASTSMLVPNRHTHSRLCKESMLLENATRAKRPSRRGSYRGHIGLTNSLPVSF